MDQNYTDTGMPSSNDFTKPKLPTGLNVLTILTFIGCAFAALYLLFLKPFYGFMLEMMDKATAGGAEISAKDLEEMEKGRAAMQLVLQNAVPIIIIGLICVIMCFVGALWMRKLKKDGFWLYTAGELLPVIASFFILGTKQFTNTMSYVFALGLPILFVFLYSLQRKYLVK